MRRPGAAVFFFPSMYRFAPEVRRSQFSARTRSPTVTLPIAKELLVSVANPSERHARTQKDRHHGQEVCKEACFWLSTLAQDLSPRKPLLSVLDRHRRGSAVPSKGFSCASCRLRDFLVILYGVADVLVARRSVRFDALTSPKPSINPSKIRERHRRN